MEWKRKVTSILVTNKDWPVLPELKQVRVGKETCDERFSVRDFRAAADMTTNDSYG